jgi:hypothetical protein
MTLSVAKHFACMGVNSGCPICTGSVLFAGAFRCEDVQDRFCVGVLER